MFWLLVLMGDLALGFLNVYYEGITEDPFIQIVHIWAAVFAFSLAFHAWLMMVMASIDAHERRQRR